MTNAERLNLITRLKAAYPYAELGPLSAEMYGAMLGDVPHAVVVAALPALLRQFPKFCPSAPELASALAEMARPGISPEAAWSEARSRVLPVGRYGSPTFSDPAITETVRQIGWTTFCDLDPTSSRDIDRLATRFRAAYADVVQRIARQDAQAALPAPVHAAVSGGQS